MSVPVKGLFHEDRSYYTSSTPAHTQAVTPPSRGIEWPQPLDLERIGFTNFSPPTLVRFSVDAGLIPVGVLKGKKSVIFEIIFENMDNALAEGQNFFLVCFSKV